MNSVPLRALAIHFAALPLDSRLQLGKPAVAPDETRWLRYKFCIYKKFGPFWHSFGRFAVMSEHSKPQDWVIKEQIVTDPVSGLTLEFAVSEDGEPHMTIYGNSLVFGNRTIVFHLDGHAASGETTIPGRCRNSSESLTGLEFPVRPNRPR